MSVEISVIIPAYNVENTLATVTDQIVEELMKLKKSNEILIVEDGSVDGTYKIAKKYSRENKNIKVIHSEKRLGKGGALKKAFLAAKGNKRIFIDADYVNIPQFLSDMVEYLGKFDIVIGNRYDKSQSTRRIFKRLIASKGYITLAKLFFFVPFSDLQCGFKGMNKHVIPLLGEIKSTDYFWDTEFLIKARKAGHSIFEIPVTWVERKSKHSASVIKDSFKFAKSLIKLRLGLL